jgi:hypothetical protein
MIILLLPFIIGIYFLSIGIIDIKQINAAIKNNKVINGKLIGVFFHQMYSIEINSIDDLNSIREREMLGYVFEYDELGKKVYGKHYIMNSLKIKPDKIYDLRLLVIGKRKVVCLDIINTYIRIKKYKQRTK